MRSTIGLSRREVSVPTAEFISICRALSAAGPAFAKKAVLLHFEPRALKIEGDMGVE